MKYALEGTKLLFLLNGVSAVSILTFIGNTSAGSKSLIGSMVIFALGAFCAVLTMAFAYLTQLHYGKAEQSPEYYTNAALKLHYAAYASLVGAGILFLVGTAAAACGLLTFVPPPKP